jgi:hypothetical protein
MSTPESDLVGPPAQTESAAPSLLFGRDRLPAVRVATGVGLALVPGLLLGTVSVQREFAVAVAPMAMLGAFGAFLLVASWAASREAAKPKGRALLILGAVLLAIVLVLLINWADAVWGFGFLPDWRPNLVVLGTLGSASGVAGWFVLRQRPARSYLALPIAVLASLAGLAPTIQFAWVVCVVVPPITAWTGWLISREKTEAQLAEMAARKVRASIDTQAQTLGREPADSALANPGQPVPNPSVVRSLSQSAGTHIYSAVTGRQRTNTLALLSLIFGLFGFGLVPIVLGHIARAQVRRTGEAGRGMALAGLILGYVIVALGVAYVLVWVVLLGMVRNATFGGH